MPHLGTCHAPNPRRPVLNSASPRCCPPVHVACAQRAPSRPELCQPTPLRTSPRCHVDRRAMSTSWRCDQSAPPWPGFSRPAPPRPSRCGQVNKCQVGRMDAQLAWLSCEHRACIPRVLQTGANGLSEAAPPWLQRTRANAHMRLVRAAPFWLQPASATTPAHLELLRAVCHAHRGAVAEGDRRVHHVVLVWLGQERIWVVWDGWL
eukprot:365394-Chlamydomonas_euryale.AAC.1